MLVAQRVVADRAMEWRPLLGGEERTRRREGRMIARVTAVIASSLAFAVTIALFALPAN